ncbi:unnamed protein product, partial [Allacma fusca]
MEDPAGRNEHITKGLLKPEALIPIVSYCVSVELDKVNINKLPADRLGSLLSYLESLEKQQLLEKLRLLTDDFENFRDVYNQRSEHVARLEAGLDARTAAVTNLQQNLLERTEAMEIMQRDIVSRAEVIEKVQESPGARADCPSEQANTNVGDQQNVRRKDEEKLRNEVFSAIAKNKEEVQHLISGVLKRLESFCSRSKGPADEAPQKQKESKISTGSSQMDEIVLQQKVLTDRVAKLEMEREESLLVHQEMKRTIAEQRKLTFEVTQKLTENTGHSNVQKCNNCDQTLADLNLLRTNQEIMLTEQKNLKQTLSSLISKCDKEFLEQISRTENFRKMLTEHTEIMEIQEEMLDKQDSLKEVQTKLAKDQLDLTMRHESSKSHLEFLSNQYKMAENSSQVVCTNLQKIETDLRSLEKNVQAIHTEQTSLQGRLLTEHNNIQCIQDKLVAEHKSLKEYQEKGIKEVKEQLFARIKDNQDVISDVQSTNKSQFEHLKQMTTRLQEKWLADHDIFSAEVLKTQEWCKKIEADQTQNFFQRNVERMKLSSSVDNLKVELENILGKVCELQDEQDKINESYRTLCKSQWKRLKMTIESSVDSDSRALMYYNGDTQLNNDAENSFRSIQYHVEASEGPTDDQSVDDLMASVPISDPSNDSEYRSVMNMFEDIDEEIRDVVDNSSDAQLIESNDKEIRESEVDKQSNTGFYFDVNFQKDVKPVLNGSNIQDNSPKDGIVFNRDTENFDSCTVDIEDDILLTDDVASTEQVVTMLLHLEMYFCTTTSPFYRLFNKALPTFLCFQFIPMDIGRQ